MSSSDSQRIDEVESRLAFMDDTVEQLNAVIIRQETEIRELRLRYSELSAKLNDLGGAVSDAEGDSQHEVPPHY
jgi:SlyX protein